MPSPSKDGRLRPMHSLEPPERTGRALWVMLLGALLVAAGAAAWYLLGHEAPTDTRSTGAVADAPPAPGRDTPTTANAPAPSTERTPDDTGRAGRPARPAPAAPKTPDAVAPAAPAARELRVTADVDGAYVFLDRKFLGSTPLTTRDVTPGSHQLNVQVEGRPPHVRTIEVLADGPTTIDVTLAPAAAAAVSASVAVVHQHAMGSCAGTLRATGDTLRYDTTHKDAFSVPLAALEQFSIAYAEKRLRVKQRGGRTWNFTTTADTADPLFVFHRDVEAARAK